MKYQSNISQGLGHVRVHAAVAVAVITLAILLFSGVAQVEAGCSRFGHSCFGAHGKRADIGPVEGRVLDNLPAQPLESGDVIYPAAPHFANYPNGMRLSPYFLDWLLATRRDQELKSHDQVSLNENSQSASAPLDMRK